MIFQIKEEEEEETILNRPKKRHLETAFTAYGEDRRSGWMGSEAHVSLASLIAGFAGLTARADHRLATLTRHGLATDPLVPQPLALAPPIDDHQNLLKQTPET
jgi:hypothetical protein